MRLDLNQLARPAAVKFRDNYAFPSLPQALFMTKRGVLARESVRLNSGRQARNSCSRARRSTSVKRKLWMKITTTRRQALSLAAPVFQADCAICERKVEFITRDEAAAWLAVTVDIIDQLIASNQLHGRQPVRGNFRICKESLFIKQ